MPSGRLVAAPHQVLGRAECRCCGPWGKSLCTGLSPLQGAEPPGQCPWYAPARVQSRPRAQARMQIWKGEATPWEPQREEPAAQSGPWPGQRRLRPRGLRGCCSPLPYLGGNVRSLTHDSGTCGGNGGARRAGASSAPHSGQSPCLWNPRVQALDPSARLTATQSPFHPLMPRSPEGLGSWGLPHRVPLPGSQAAAGSCR